MTSWTVALQAPLSVDFFSQEYWSGLPFPPPGDLPDWGMEPESLVSPVLVGRFFTTVPSGKPSMYQDILPFYGWVRFHCKYIPHFCLSIPLFMDSWHPILSHKPRVGGSPLILPFPIILTSNVSASLIHLTPPIQLLLLFQNHCYPAARTPTPLSPNS